MIIYLIDIIHNIYYISQPGQDYYLFPPIALPHLVIESRTFHQFSAILHISDFYSEYKNTNLEKDKKIIPKNFFVLSIDSWMCKKNKITFYLELLFHKKMFCPVLLVSIFFANFINIYNIILYRYIYYVDGMWACIYVWGHQNELKPSVCCRKDYCIY